MAQPMKAQEPSMEEILASIRRIIADDEADAAPKAEEPTAAAPAPTPPPSPQPETPPEMPPSPPPAAAAPPPPMPEPELVAESPAEVGIAAQTPPDILELTEEMTAPEPEPETELEPPRAANGFRTIDGEPDVVFSEPVEETDETDMQHPHVVEEARHEFAGEQTLLSTTTQSAVDSAFNALAHTVLEQNARTLEELVREMLRPMLKTWLDDNLPGVVERLVRAEIERVSRGRP